MLESITIKERNSENVIHLFV